MRRGKGFFSQKEGGEVFSLLLKDDVLQGKKKKKFIFVCACQGGDQKKIGDPRSQTPLLPVKMIAPLSDPACTFRLNEM